MFHQIELPYADSGSKLNEMFLANEIVESMHFTFHIIILR